MDVVRHHDERIDGDTETLRQALELCPDSRTDAAEANCIGSYLAERASPNTRANRHEVEAFASVVECA